MSVSTDASVKNDIRTRSRSRKRKIRIVRLKKGVINHCRRIFVLFLNGLLRHNWFFWILGVLNRRFQFMESVFVVYPATEKYALAYVYKRHLDKMRWTPYIGGIIFQDGKMQIMFVISSTEKEFNDSDQRENLKEMVARVDKIRKLLAAPNKRFAGVLPGILLSRKLINSSVEIDVTVEAVILALEDVENQRGYRNVPVIVLGGKGFIGRKLTERLNQSGVKTYCVDINGSLNWPGHLRGEAAIVINVTRKAVLSKYLPYFWKELVLINEVYPEPGDQELSQLRKIGSDSFHVTGVKAKALPPFPRAYAGGIPCCGAHPSSTMEVLIRKLT